MTLGAPGRGFGLGRKRSRGMSFWASMKNLSPLLKEAAWMPSEGLMVKKTWLMGPSTSSILPTDVLFSRYMMALNWGTLVLMLSQTISPSHECRNLPMGWTSDGGPKSRCWKPPRPA